MFVASGLMANERDMVWEAAYVNQLETIKSTLVSLFRETTDAMGLAKYDLAER
jgi:hypothetical protein